MLQFLNLRPEIFGIDINDLSLKIIRLKKKRKGFNLVSYNEVDIKSGIVEEGVIKNEEALVKIIKSACKTVKGKKLGTKYVVAALPEEKSFSQVIQMPEMNKDELKSAVPFEAENYIPLPIDKVYLDFQAINLAKDGVDYCDDKHCDLLIAATPKSIVDSYVSCLKKSGFIPHALEVESQAVARALVKKDSNTKPLIFIDLGKTKTSFIIFSGNSIRFTSSIPIFSDQITLAISEVFSISYNEAEELKIKYGLLQEKGSQIDVSTIMKPILRDLVSQIKKYISFYHDHVFHEYFPADGNIEKIILCGGGANLKGITDFLSKELKIKVELADPFTNIIMGKNGKHISLNKKSLSFVIAIGLALREEEDNK